MVTINGEQVGRIEKKSGEKRYVTRRKPDGYVRKHDGFAISSELFDNSSGTPNLIHEVDAIELHFLDEDGVEHVYETTPDHWKNAGIEDQLGEFEEQIFLPADDFHAHRQVATA